VKNEDGVGNTDFALQQAHVKQQPVSPRRRVPSIPADLDEIIMKALAKAPDDRLPGCQEFVRLLDQVGKSMDGGGDGGGASAGSVARPSWARKIGVAVLVAVAAALLALIWSLAR
jgi:serine/threonine-protein kinase